MNLSFKKSILFILLSISLIFFFRNAIYIISNDKICIQDKTLVIEHKVTRESILKNQYPGWDPYHSRPILSNPKSQIFYPPALILNLILTPELMIKAMLCISVIISLFAFYKLSILFGFEKEIGVFLSFLYVAFSNIPIHIITCKLEYIFSYSLIPFVFLFYTYWMRSKEKKYFFFSIIFLSFINLAGDAPLFVITTIFMLLYSKILRKKFSFYIPLFAFLISSIKFFPYFMLNFNVSVIKIFLPDNSSLFIPFLFIIILFLFKRNFEGKYQDIFFIFLTFLALYALILNYQFNFKITQSIAAKISPQYVLKTSNITNLSVVHATPNEISGYLYLNQSQINIAPADLFFINTYYYPLNGWYGYLDDELVFSYAGFSGVIQSPINISTGTHKFTLEYHPLSTKFGLQITIFFLFLFILYFLKPHIFFDQIDKIFFLIIVVLQIQLFMRMFQEESIQELAPEEIALFELTRSYSFPSAYTTHAGYVTPSITSFVWRLSFWLTKSYTIKYTSIIPYFFYFLSSLILFLLARDFLSKKVAVLALMLYVSDEILIRITRILMDCHLLPFFILATLYFLLKYINSKNLRRFFYLFLSAIITGLGAMVQFSYLMFLIPCLIIFLILYRKKIKFIELFIYFTIFLILVFPHIKSSYTSNNLIQASFNVVKDLVNRYFQILFFREKRGINLFNPTHISNFYFLTENKLITFFIYMIFVITTLILGFFNKMIKKEDLFIFLTSLICIVIFPSYETIGILLIPLWILLITRSLDIFFTFTNKHLNLFY